MSREYRRTDHEGAELTSDDVFDILGNRRRRYVFQHLKRNPEREIPVSELADAVAGWERDQSPDAVDQAEHNRVRTALRQCHLPKMAENGFVDYECDRGTVRLGPAASSLDVYLDVVDRWDIPWSIYYLALAGAFAVLLAVTTADVWPFEGITTGACASILIVSLAVSALVHSYVTLTEMRIGSSEYPPELRQR